MLSSILIVAEESKEVKELAQGLSRAGFDFRFVPPDADITLEAGRDGTPLVIIEVSEAFSFNHLEDSSQRIRRVMTIPVMALIPKWALFNLKPGFPIDDFVVLPCDEREFILRVRWLLHATGVPDLGEVVKGGELAVDTAKAEVTLGGQRLDITFREYELLRFLMSNKGRVFTREALLNKVWGYDYFGGDRTVDVHIRRLRSKIEVNGTIYIETVRNIGYRFREDL